MKKSLGIFLCASLLSASSFAQVRKIWGDPHVVEKFNAEAIKDPAYIGLKADLAALSKSAKGRNTNANAARALLARNSELLKAIYKRANLEAPQPMDGRQPKKVQLKPGLQSMLLSKAILMGEKLNKTETPPYDKEWHGGDYVYMSGVPDTSSSVFLAGKTVMSYGMPASPIAIRLGQYIQGYKQNFTVPSNPAIIAAEIKLEYSFIYDGWDSYGARLGMDLVLNIKNISGTDYNNLPDYYLQNTNYGAYNTNHKHIATLYPSDTIETDFGEFHAAADTSFTVSGYVTPGTVIELVMGAGYDKYTVRGLNGSYHYAEFILKKISVHYYKTAN
jgi:hypothetical protein